MRQMRISRPLDGQLASMDVATIDVSLLRGSRYGHQLMSTARVSPPLTFIRPSVRAMEPYTPGEQPQQGGYIKLNTNENPYPPSPKVAEAIRRCATADVRLYPDPMATALREAAAARFDLTADHILAGNGSDELLSLVLRACVDAGDRVVYPVPTYSLYDTLVAIAGGTAVRVPWPADYSLPDGVGAADGRVTFLCNPNAPSGTMVPIDAVAALGERLSGLLVVDEAYVDFADDSALRLVRERSNVLVLRTFSKSFSLAGLRVGLAFGDPALIRELCTVKDSYNLNRVSIAAGAAALEDYEVMREHVRRIRATRARLSDGLRALGYSVPPSQANFVLARRPSRDQRPVYDALKQRRILVRYFATPQLSDALRITVGTDEEVDALLAALAEIAQP
jgi:histidinol-phosphate aminotransferase